MEKVFEHEVALDRYTTLSFTRKEIWDQLVDLLKHPSLAIEPIESDHFKEITSDSGQTVLERELDFGNVKVHDSVKLDLEKSALVTIPHHEKYPESMHRITILEPQPGKFGFKFEYYEDISHPEVLDTAPYAKLRYKAWEDKDLHFCQVLVEMLEKHRT
ncbi:MAG: DUF1857 family protein [Burkholderiales bacterium]|nr:DUF1857 family protein [Burkholderiales bacterium]